MVEGKKQSLTLENQTDTTVFLEAVLELMFLLAIMNLTEDKGHSSTMKLCDKTRPLDSFV